MHFLRVQPPFLLGEGLIELTRYNFERDLARARFGADGASAGGASASDSAVQQTTGKAPRICACVIHFHTEVSAAGRAAG